VPNIKKPVMAFLMLLLSSCVGPLTYDGGDWRKFVAGDRCQQHRISTADAIVSNKQNHPFFMVTSRLPDCQAPKIRLTQQRGDQIRYARFAIPPETNDRKANLALEGKMDLIFTPQSIWLNQINAEAKAAGGRILIYVHGYYEQYFEPASRLARIAKVSEFKGPLIQYSWPSHGKALRYWSDEENQNWERDYFVATLHNLVALPDVQKILVIGHSLGTRMVVNGVESLDRERPDDMNSKIKNIILASGDLDRQIFERKAQYGLLRPEKVAAGRRITAYVSAKDNAIRISHTIHGLPRLGRPICSDLAQRRVLKADGLPERCYARLTNPEPGQINGLHIIDTSEVSNSRAGHSDFIMSGVACADFVGVVKGTSVPENRRIKTQHENIWTLNSDASSGPCAGSAR